MNAALLSNSGNFTPALLSLGEDVRHRMFVDPISADGGKAASRVVIIESIHGLRDRLTHAIAQETDHEQICVFSVAKPALELLRRFPARMAVLGLELTDLDALEMLDMIIAERLAHKIVVVALHADEWSIEHLRRSRLDGFFDLHVDTLEIFAEAIKAIARGGHYFSSTLNIASAQGAGILRRMLTDRELVLFAEFGDGSDDRDVAERLSLTPATVRTHRRNIMRKLGIHRTTELMHEALQRGAVRFVDRRILRRNLGSAVSGLSFSPG